jgi:hypothetical protein
VRRHFADLAGSLAQALSGSLFFCILQLMSESSQAAGRLKGEALGEIRSHSRSLPTAGSPKML